MMPIGDLRTVVIGKIAEQIGNECPSIDPAKATSVAVEIYDTHEEREAALKGVKITKQLIRARADCFIFFRLMTEGWGDRMRLPSGAFVTVNYSLMLDERLNFPKRSRLIAASKRVRQTCSDEAAEFKLAVRNWREAHRRYVATETDESWEWYKSGKGNRNSVAYRCKMDFSHQGEWYFRTRRLFKYTLHELLPRADERERALQEMREADATMIEQRMKIFERMGVPPPCRHYI